MHYLITFAGYGCRLHGDDRGSFHREFGALREEPELESYERALMTEPAYALDEQRRAVVLDAICSVARMRQWYLCAAHVRQEHVHVVVDAGDAPVARTLGDLKAYAGMALRAAGFDVERKKRWARFGSTIPLRDRAQGAPMAVFLDPNVTHG
jgi:hypothetical protein